MAIVAISYGGGCYNGCINKVVAPFSTATIAVMTAPTIAACIQDKRTFQKSH